MSLGWAYWDLINMVINKNRNDKILLHVSFRYPKKINLFSNKKYLAPTHTCYLDKC